MLIAAEDVDPRSWRVKDRWDRSHRLQRAAVVYWCFDKIAAAVMKIDRVTPDELDEDWTRWAVLRCCRLDAIWPPWTMRDPARMTTPSTTFPTDGANCRGIITADATWGSL